MLGWFKSETRLRRRKVKFDRKHVEGRARRFLRSYLEANEVRKPHFYRAVHNISGKCHPTEFDNRADLEDRQIAEAISKAALAMVVDRASRIHGDDRVGNFVTDACATVALAYQRAAGVYVDDGKMQELGTAAVHLLTMATSYFNSQKNDEGEQANRQNG